MQIDHSSDTTIVSVTNCVYLAICLQNISFKYEDTDLLNSKDMFYELLSQLF